MTDETEALGRTDAACIGALLRAADTVKRQMSTVLEACGVTGQQYNVLRILRGAERGTLPTLEIAARMLEQTPGITRLLDRLERKGLVTRKRDDNDRRQVFCSITGSGLELLGSLDEAVSRSNARALAPLSGGERAALLELLSRLGTPTLGDPTPGTPTSGDPTPGDKQLTEANL